MFCPKCGKEFGEGAAFCVKCGNALSAVKSSPSGDISQNKTSSRGAYIFFILLLLIVSAYVGSQHWQKINLHIDQGKKYYDKKQYDRALAELNKVIELDPKNSMAYNNRAVVYSDKEQYDEALADFNKAIELNPDDDTRQLIQKHINELKQTISQQRKH
jgi:tetratricopeptide (TPR) repeat protein